MLGSYLDLMEKNYFLTSYVLFLKLSKDMNSLTYFLQTFDCLIKPKRLIEKTKIILTSQILFCTSTIQFHTRKLISQHFTWNKESTFTSQHEFSPGKERYGHKFKTETFSLLLMFISSICIAYLCMYLHAYKDVPLHLPHFHRYLSASCHSLRSGRPTSSLAYRQFNSTK